MRFGLGAWGSRHAVCMIVNMVLAASEERREGERRMCAETVAEPMAEPGAQGQNLREHFHVFGFLIA